MVHSWAGPSAVWLTVTESGSEVEEVPVIAVGSVLDLELEFKLSLELLLKLELESALLSIVLSLLPVLLPVLVLSFAETGLRDWALAHEVTAAAVTITMVRLHASAICLLFILLCPVSF